MENTKIQYMYRDASNYKEHNEVIFAGKVSQKDFLYLIELMEKDIGFIASEVGLESLQERMTSFPSSDDHVYHTIDGITLTEEEPTESITIEEFMNLIRNRPDNVVKAMEELGLF